MSLDLQHVALRKMTRPADVLILELIALNAEYQYEFEWEALHDGQVCVCVCGREREREFVCVFVPNLSGRRCTTGRCVGGWVHWCVFVRSCVCVCRI